MANLTIRKLDEGTHARLRERAARNARSVEAEVRAILDAAVQPTPSTLAGALMAMAEYDDGTDLELPPRTRPTRPIDLA